MIERKSKPGPVRRPITAATALLLLTALGCDGDGGPPGVVGPPGGRLIETNLDREADLPGFVVKIEKLAGGSGATGNFLPGDTLSVTFSFRLEDGTVIPLDQVDSAGILASGPTGNYQPVLEYQRDLLSASIANADGTYTYTFPVPIPATYLPPLNDTAAIGAADGELQGQALLDGTYTVGIEGYKNYTIEDESFRDAGNATADFLVGAATAIEKREVVTTANCNQCHSSIRAHGAIRRDIALCVLCHTAGAEDKNEPTAAGGTPGTTIDFKVMIHRIHNGAHLPSVLGVATNADGTRKYDATPKPYQIVGYRNSVHDFSHVGFPVWPNLSDPLPRDAGYSALSTTEKGLENTIRSGVASCAKCHGDPDGSGPLPAPAQGERARSAPSRAACGSCHDDVDWTKSYAANLLAMPPQPDDSGCTKCHPAEGGPLAVKTGHMHPLLDPVKNAGLVFKITGFSESGTHNNNQKLDPGETLRVKFDIEDGSGRPVDVSTLSRMEVVVNGPTTNRNILLEERIPNGLFMGSSFDAPLPQKVYLEYVGDAKSTTGTFTTKGNHWNGAGAETTVRVRTTTSSGATTTLDGAAAAGQNYCDVASSAGFARGDYIVIDDANAEEEYLRIQWIEGNRLWFSSTHGPYDQPELREAHASGASLDTVAFDTKVAGTDYSVNGASGVITELVAFGADRAVVVSYTTDFVIPDDYPVALNAEPALDETRGSFAGKPLAGGTYTVTMWGERDIEVTVGTEDTSYHATSKAGVGHFLVGSATKIVTSGVISSENNCYACHDDLRFHGGHRRGFDTCLACHGTAGAGDRPRYVAANAPPTTGVSVEFRSMLHEIHTGKDLANPSTFTIVGYGSGYPNNYSAHTYEHVGFPAMPGGTRGCAMCHGAGNTAWSDVAGRDHPTAQTRPVRVWAVACGSCHDSAKAQGHIASGTSQKGAESCAVCHGPGRTWNVELMHKLR